MNLMVFPFAVLCSDELPGLTWMQSYPLNGFGEARRECWAPYGERNHVVGTSRICCSIPFESADYVSEVGCGREIWDATHWILRIFSLLNSPFANGHSLFVEQVSSLLECEAKTVGNPLDCPALGVQ